MLIADSSIQVRIPAWIATKDMGTFHCPECKKEVILHKGSIRQHHYKHKPPIDCPYGAGESELHWQAKRAIYESLKQQLNSSVELEYRLDGVRPDVYFEHSGVRVAVEIQKTSQSIEQIDWKTRKYYSLGVHVLWILPESGPRWVEREDEAVCRINTWHEYLHTMYFGRIYYWQKEAVVRAAHLDKFYRDIPEGNWVEDYENDVGDDLSGTYWYQENYDDAHYGGGKRLVKTFRRVNWFTRELNIGADFRPTRRDFFSCPRYTVSPSRLWMDKERAWWKKDK